jgi:hypothetical protein
VKIIPMGSVFGSRTVIAPAPPDTAGNRRVICRCKCGDEAPVPLRDLRNGRRLQCRKCSRLATFSVGDTFGKWTILGEAEPAAVGHFQRVTCQCKCGTRAVVRLGHLKSGRSTQCVKCRPAAYTKEQVLEMRRLRLEGWTFVALADKFHCNPQTAQRITSGRYYSHITAELEGEG